MADVHSRFLISSVAWQGIPHAQAITQVRDAGFGGVEILCKPGHFEPDNPAHVEGVRAALDDWPDADVTFHAPYYHVDLSSSDPAVREHDLRRVREAIETASSFRARNVTIHVRGNPNMRFWDPENRPALDQSLRALADTVVKLGMTLCVENSPPPCFTCHERDVVSAIEGFPADTVGACIDTGHAHLAGRAVELAGALASSAFVAHLHDNHAAEKDQHLIPGGGTIPWAELVAAMRPSFRGRLVMEVLMDGDLARTLDKTKRAIAETGLSGLVGR